MRWGQWTGFKHLQVPPGRQYEWKLVEEGANGGRASTQTHSRQLSTP